jgi:hypothetical protein
MESRLMKPEVKTYLYHVADIRKDQPGYKSQTLHTDDESLDSYSFDHFSDILDNMQSGMYGNRLITHSQTRKIWREYDFDYPGSFDQYQHLYPGNKLYGFTADLADPANKLKVYPVGYDKDNLPFHVDEWLPIRISQLQQLQNIKITMSLPGDSDRTVGQVVILQLPSPEPPVNMTQKMDLYYQGRFLIQSIRHKIVSTDYTTTMTLVKDSVFQAYP